MGAPDSQSETGRPDSREDIGTQDTQLGDSPQGVAAQDQNV